MTPYIAGRTESGILDHSNALQLFFYLQVLDFLTTMIGFRLGASELSPFVRWLTTFNPATGVLLSKGVAVLLADIVFGGGDSA